MVSTNTRIFKILGLTIVIFVFLIIFYYSPLSKLLKQAPESLKNVGREILTPGPLRSEQEKEIKSVLSDKEIIEITNEYRNKYGKGSLRENEILNKAAMARIDDMFQQQYFEHVSPQGTDVSDTLKSLQYPYVIAGENLALGYFADSRDLVDAWMASPGHRENILKAEYKEIGVAHKIGIFKGKKQYLAVQVFATSSNDCPLPDEKLKNQIESKEREISSLKTNLQSLNLEIDNLKAQIDYLYKEINSLISEGQSLISQGNNLILKGNQIYSQTGDRNLAEQYWAEGEALQKQGKAKLDEANSKKAMLDSLQSQLQEKINYYNFLVSQINSTTQLLKSLIFEYNKQVDAFQNCL